MTFIMRYFSYFLGSRIPNWPADLLVKRIPLQAYAGAVNHFSCRCVKVLLYCGSNV